MTKSRFLMIVVILTIIVIFASCEKSAKKDESQGIASVEKQDKPSFGYDKVVWGASLSDVREAYQISDEIGSKSLFADPNITLLEQENVSDSIRTREFSFISDKLYKVKIRYSSDTDANALANLLSNKYGNSTDSSQQLNYAMGMRGQTDQLIYEKFSPDIVVELVQNQTDMGILGIAKSCEVTYTWKKYYDSYQVSKIDL